MGSSVAITRPYWRFSRRVVLPVALSALAIIAAMTLALLFSTDAANHVAVGRQVRMTRQSISASIDMLAQNQEVVAVWDELVVEVERGLPDAQWLDDNVGGWLHDAYGHNQVYMLDAADRPIYAVVGGERVAPSRFEAARPAIAPMLAELRTGQAPPGHRHDRLSRVDRMTLLPSGVRMPEKAVHASHLAKIDGRPAAVSVMKIVPNSPDFRPPPGPEPLIVSVRFLDGSFLRELSARNLIEGLRFSSADDRRPGEAAIPLISETGGRIGAIYWMPEMPGRRLLKTLSPIVAAAVLAMLGLLAWLVRSLRRSSLELQASEAHANYLAYHDLLTGLPNRAHFDEVLDAALLRTRREGAPVAVLILDLDRFKNVNDTLGHAAGDQLIREFGGRLSRLARPSDTIARLGGDEFILLRPDPVSAHDIELLCDQILDSVGEPFDVSAGYAFVGVSIGVAVAPAAGVDRAELLRKCDIALYQAKAAGRGCWRLFTGDMDESIQRRGTIEEELRSALAAPEGGGLHLHYQPQISAMNGSIVGVEALLRWDHPTLGSIAPEQFVSVAEDSGLIAALGQWVFRHVCEATRRWPEIVIGINLSARQFRDAAFADTLIAMARELGADPTRIELEITESVLMDVDSLGSATVRRLRGHGFRIALDDFGTGYSSFAYLRRFPVDTIKIDRSFIQNLGQSADSAAIVTAIIALGRAMSLRVTAEGVETMQQRRYLADAGCSAFQGYLFSRPVPGDEIARLIEEERVLPA